MLCFTDPQLLASAVAPETSKSTQPIAPGAPNCIGALQLQQQFLLFSRPSASSCSCHSGTQQRPHTSPAVPPCSSLCVSSSSLRSTGGGGAWGFWGLGLGAAEAVLLPVAADVAVTKFAAVCVWGAAPSRKSSHRAVKEV
jgi:hypothetical protein